MRIFEGKEYVSDTGRIIRKYDIYICDLGKPANNNLGKNRPCVIIQSNKINNPKQNRYIVAPIRTEHQMEVTEDTLQEIVSTKRELGRSYVPIEIEPGKFRFIDMTRIESVQSSEVKEYKCSIINPKLKAKINDTLCELLLSDDENEFSHKSEEYVEQKEVVNSLEEIQTATHEEQEPEKTKSSGKGRGGRRRVVKFDDKFIEIYYKWLDKEINPKDAADQLNVGYSTFHRAAQNYEILNNINRDELRKERAANKSNKNQTVKTQQEVISFIDAYEKIVTQKLTIDEVAPIFRLDRDAFIKHIEEYEENEIFKFNEYKRKHSRKCRKLQLPNEFIRTHMQWKAKMINGEEASSQLNLSYNNFIYLAKQYKNYKELNCKQ